MITLHANSNAKSVLYDLMDEEVTDLPKASTLNTICVSIPLSDITNVDDELYSGVSIARFIKEHVDALKVIPAFKYSPLTTQWYFELSVQEFAKIRGWEIKQHFQSKMLAKYPVWKQLNLANDKDYALLRLSDLTPFSPSDVMKKILEVVPVTHDSKLTAINSFARSINSLDFKQQFACLHPTTFRVADIQPWVARILNYLVYYFRSCRLRLMADEEEKKLTLCTTYEAVSLHTPTDPQI